MWLGHLCLLMITYGLLKLSSYPLKETGTGVLFWGLYFKRRAPGSLRKTFPGVADLHLKGAKKEVIILSFLKLILRKKSGQGVHSQEEICPKFSQAWVSTVTTVTLGDWLFRCKGMNYIGLKASCSTGSWISRNSSIGPQKRCDQLREPPHSGSPRVMASHKVFRSRYNLPIFCMVSQWSFLPCAFQAQLTFYLYHVFAGRKQKFNQESTMEGEGIFILHS